MFKDIIIDAKMLYGRTEIGIFEFGLCKFIAHVYLIKIKIISDSMKDTKAKKIPTKSYSL